MSDEKTLLHELRERERDNPPWMYACYRVGHVLTESGLCLCCLQQFEPPPAEPEVPLP